MHVIYATVAEFNKFEVFVKDLVVLAGFREVRLDKCLKGFAYWDVFTEGKLNQIAVIFLPLWLLGGVIKKDNSALEIGRAHV